MEIGGGEDPRAGIFDQGEYWIDAEERRHLLAEMSEDYLKKVRVYLHQQCSVLYRIEHPDRLDQWGEITGSEQWQIGMGWMTGTTLFQAIETELESRSWLSNPRLPESLEQMRRGEFAALPREWADDEDFLDEILEERSKENPEFPDLVDKAGARRLLRGDRPSDSDDFNTPTRRESLRLAWKHWRGISVAGGHLRELLWDLVRLNRFDYYAWACSMRAWEEDPQGRSEQGNVSARPGKDWDPED